jgi:poly(A) polymerase
MNEILSLLPKQVIAILDIFQDNIRLVGGAVRDILANKKTQDYDFCSLLTPQEIINTLRQHNIKAIDINVTYGTIIALLDGYQFAITTARSDQNCSGRSCDVQFCQNYIDDSARRDFTINALYLDFRGQIYDYHCGLQHLQQKKLLFIGDPVARIQEDHLRILRFFRFSIDYCADESALQSCLANAKLLKTLSRTRIRQEIMKIIKNSDLASLVKILSIFNQHFSAFLALKFDINALQNNKINNICQDDVLLIALAFLDCDINNLAFDLARREKKILQQLQQNLLIFPIQNEQKQLLALQYLLFSSDIFMLHTIFLFEKNIINHNVFDNFLTNYQLWQQHKFPVNACDLVNINNNKISTVLQLAKKQWIKEQFLPTKQDLLNFIDNH